MRRAKRTSSLMRSRYIVVVGCGRLGSRLATHLSSQGHSVVAVDLNAAKFENLSVEFTGFTIQGDAREAAVLREAKIGQADVLFAVTTRDNVNLMVAQVAREVYGVGAVVARVFDPASEQIYHELGIETVNPMVLSAAAFLERCGLREPALRL